MSDKKLELLTKELIELNDKFHKKLLVNESFYKKLMQNGFAYRQCFLISIFPDSSNTYCGKIINQHGKVIEFDMDLDSDENSLWDDVTDKFYELYVKNEYPKPWIIETVAYKLFYEMIKQ